MTTTHTPDARDALEQWSGHVAVLSYGEDHVEPTNDDDGQEHYEITIECERPELCSGWVTCDDGEHPEHTGEDDLVLHGVPHVWRGVDAGWTVDAHGCIVAMSANWTDSLSECAYDLVRQAGVGRWRVNARWDDFGPVLSLISGDPDVYTAP